jgi:hypothetical protein
VLTNDKVMIISKKYLKKIPVSFRLSFSKHGFLFILDDQLSSITKQCLRYVDVTQFKRGRVIGMREAGLSYRANTHRVGQNVATVLRCCAWLELLYQNMLFLGVAFSKIKYEISV